MSEWIPIGEAIGDWGDPEVEGYERGPTRSEVEARVRRRNTSWEKKRRSDETRIDRGVVGKRKTDKVQDREER